MSHKKVCCVCGTNVKDVLNLGEMKYLDEISVHYYCLVCGKIMIDNQLINVCDFEINF